MSRKRITLRTANKLQNLALQLEGITQSLREAGFDSEALGLRRVKDELGAVGRELETRLMSR